LINGSDLSRVDTRLKIIRSASEKKNQWQIYKYSELAVAGRAGRVPMIKRGTRQVAIIIADPYRRRLSGASD